MEKVENAIIHCSTSSFGCVREIRKWHLQKGWRDIGYHFVILNGKIIKNFNIPSLDGSIEVGRYLDEDLMIEPNERGAHALGYNANSIGICLIGGIGEPQFTSRQRANLISLLTDLMVHFKLSSDAILGHYETESGKKQGKTCPNFDVGEIREILKMVSEGLKC